MQTIFDKIISGVITIALGVATIFGYGGGIATKSDLIPRTLGGVLPIAGTTYNLAGSGASLSATSLTLQSLTLPQTAQKLYDSDFSTTFYVTLEPGNRTHQELVSCTTVTQNSGGTATLSGCSRGLSPITPYTASSTLQFTHGGGSQVIFSDPPQLFNQYAAKSNDETITGLYTFSTGGFIDTASSTFTGGLTITNGLASTFTGTTTAEAGVLVSTPYRCTAASSANQLCEKNYIDAQVVAGGTDATLTVKGISERATVGEINAGTATGGTGASLFINPNEFQYSTFASTTVNTWATTSAQNLATTTLTLTNMPTNATKLSFFFHATSTVSGIALPKLFFNTYTGATDYGWNRTEAKTDSSVNNANSTSDDSVDLFTNGDSGELAITGEVHKVNGFWYYGSYYTNMSNMEIGSFYWKQTAAITSISFTTGSLNPLVRFATSTYITVTAN